MLLLAEDGAREGDFDFATAPSGRMCLGAVVKEGMDEWLGATLGGTRASARRSGTLR